MLSATTKYRPPDRVSQSIRSGCDGELVSRVEKGEREQTRQGDSAVAEISNGREVVAKLPTGGWLSVLGGAVLVPTAFRLIRSVMDPSGTDAADVVVSLVFLAVGLALLFRGRRHQQR
jgi:hypothetical protein